MTNYAIPTVVSALFVLVTVYLFGQVDAIAGTVAGSASVDLRAAETDEDDKKAKTNLGKLARDVGQAAKDVGQFVGQIGDLFRKKR